MADSWNIVCTTFMKYKIVTEGGQVLIKPRKQPLNLESQIDDELSNINNIVYDSISPLKEANL